jgi:hypothetical protein
MNRQTLLILLAILNIIVIAVMQSFSSSLEPYSIIGFEFAGSAEKAQMMVNAWQEKGVLGQVYFVTGFDYLFMVTYSTFLWLACVSLAKDLPERSSHGLIVLAWLQPIAGLLDALENFALYQIISGSWESHWPTISMVCATPKFIITLSAVLACLLALAYKTLRKRFT